MNKIFMNGYYQGVIEVAPASLSAAKVEELANCDDYSASSSCRD